MSGYVYCITNPSMPGLVKIGYTERTLEERLQEANLSTWVPQPFSIAFAKFVKQPNAKEQTIHRILAECRVNPKREFFQTDPESVRPLFELMDGPWWDPDEVDTDTPVLGDDVIRLFLDKHIYPPTDDGQSVSWGEIAAAFQTWKRTEGVTAGNAVKLRERLVEAHGKPNRGEGWTAFSLRCPAKTDS